MKLLLASTALTLSMGLAQVGYADDAAPLPPAETAAPAANAADPVVTGSGTAMLAPGAMLASDLIGADVIGPNGDDVGTVDDLVLDAGGKIEQVIIADGAIFGLGGKNVAVDYRGSQLGHAGTGMTTGNATAVEPSTAAPTTTSGTATGTEIPGAPDEPVIRVSLTDDALGRAAEFDKSALEQQGDRLASSYLDRDVTLASGDAKGEVSDLLLDQSGTVKYAIISFGGVLNMGGTKVAVGIDQLSGAPEGEPMRLAMTEAELEAAPKFDPRR